jgi:hypothetical protein
MHAPMVLLVQMLASAATFVSTDDDLVALDAEIHSHWPQGEPNDKRHEYWRHVVESVLVRGAAPCMNYSCIMLEPDASDTCLLSAELDAEGCADAGI